MIAGYAGWRPAGYELIGEEAREHGAEKSHVAEALMTASLIASGSQLAWMMDDYQNLLG